MYMKKKFRFGVVCFYFLTGLLVISSGAFESPAEGEAALERGYDKRLKRSVRSNRNPKVKSIL